jgi:Cdc6-like AAA superfamily ATPase
MARARSRGKQKKRGGRGGADRDGWLGRLGELAEGFLLGREVDTPTAMRLQEIKGLVLIGVSVWLLLSIATYYTPYDDPLAEGRNWCGEVGYYLANGIHMAIGWAGYMLCLLGVAWGAVLVTRKTIAWPGLRLFGGVCFLFAAAFLLQLGFGETFTPGAPGARAGLNGTPFGPGGYLAQQMVGPALATDGSTPQLLAKFGEPGSWILLTLVALVSFMLATEMAFYPAVRALVEWVEDRRERTGQTVTGVLLGWAKRLFAGLWGFLRGAEIGADVPEAAEAAGAPRAARAPTRRKRAAADPTGDLFAEEEGEEDEEEDDEEEYEDGEDEYEGEYDEEDEYEDEEDDDEEYEDEKEGEDEEEDEAEIAPTPRKRPAAERTRVRTLAALEFEPPTPPKGPWKFPPLDVLEAPSGRTRDDERAIEDAATKLEHALASFRVEAGVVGAQVGPTVTLYELEVAQGTRMNKVTQLSSEIAAALRARSVRIIAPIPGKSTVGIEVPNPARRVVRLAELIHQQAYDKKFAALPLFLGMDTEGKPVVEDLARMPHLLIAGTTGSGKSVCINTILASLLLTRSPHDVQLILVDPKMVELQMFAQVPHLLLPIVSDARQATNVLLWACEKMEGRYELFKEAGVKNIKGYNALSENQLRERLGDDFDEERTPRHIGYIVIVIDEMADLMMASKKEAEQAITRLAQKSRAVGIHVIVATQRPSTDVITGVLKGNLPTRIAFQVASKVDSRVILDHVGAEKLLGQGDMLYTPPQSSQLRRVQGALVQDHEIGSLVEFVCKESAPNFNQELVQAATGSRSSQTGSGMKEDELFDEAVRIVLKTRRGSASMLQRALGIGYTRASRLIDLMGMEGILGEHKGSKARELLMTLEDWEEMHGAPLGAGGHDE